MRDLLRGLAAASLLFGVSLSVDAHAADAGAAKAVTADAGSTRSATADPHDPHAELAPGDPGNPHDDHDPHGNPHAGHGMSADGVFNAPEDGSAEDPTVPPGSIVVDIADPDGKPMPNVDVTLGILVTSVAKGESKKRVTAKADMRGRARFDHLETGSGVAYRAMVLSDSATFSVPPFQLPAKSGIRALLHVYPVVHSDTETLIVTQSILFAEVKDDRVQVQQAFRIYNFGKAAWVPRDHVIELPPKYTAFNAQQGMTDVGVDAVPDKGVKLRGTFPPGQQVVEFRWQLPYSGEADVSFDVGMPPNTAAARVIAPASKGVSLDVPGFPPPEVTTDGTGQRALVTEVQLRRDEKPLRRLAVAIHGLPTEGPGKVLATLLTAIVICGGLVFGTRKPPAKDRVAERARLLSEVDELERARASGEVGPKTYEKARRELVDEIAQTYAEEGPPPGQEPARGGSKVTARSASKRKREERERV